MSRHRAIPTPTEFEGVLGDVERGMASLVTAKSAEPYSAIKVVLMNWEQSDLNPAVHDETIELQTVFREKYMYDAGQPAEIFRIPSRDSQKELDTHVRDSLQKFSKLNTSSRKLMIVYYNGHGHIDPDTGELKLAGGPSNHPRFVPWSGIEKRLEDVKKFDLLLIMDCCYAARAVKSAPSKAMQALFAVSGETPARMRDGRSIFTSALKRQLETLSKRPAGFPISELASLLHRDRTLSNQSPNHVVLQGYNNTIVLHAMNAAPQRAPTARVHAGSQTQSSISNTRSYRPANYPVSSSSDIPPLRVKAVDEDNRSHQMKYIIDSTCSISLLSLHAIRSLNLRSIQKESQPRWAAGDYVDKRKHPYEPISGYVWIGLQEDDYRESFKFHILEDQEFFKGADMIIGRNVLASREIIIPVLERAHDELKEKLRAQNSGNRHATQTSRDEGALTDRLTKLRQILQDARDARQSQLPKEHQEIRRHMTT